MLLDLDRIAAAHVEVLVAAPVVEEFDPVRGTPNPPVAAPEPAPNGRTFAYLRATTDGATRLVMDAAQMLTGRDAVAACQAIGNQDCGFDYLIVNPDGHESAAPVAADAAVVLVDWPHCCDKTVRGSVADLARALRAPADDPLRDTYRIATPFWVTVENGVVVRIEEQYLL